MTPNSDFVVQTEQLSKIFRVGFWGKRVTAVEVSTSKSDQGKFSVFSARTVLGKPRPSRS